VERTRPQFGDRRSIRLENADYARPGIYFVTICADARRSIFGCFENSRFSPSRVGQIVHESWTAIPEHFPRVDIDQFVVTPNHIHGILVFHPIVGAQHRCALPQVTALHHSGASSLAEVVRSFKAIVTRRAHEELCWKGCVWQRNYFERIVRDGQEFADTCRYIAENPLRWECDAENPKFRQEKEKGAAVLRPYKPMSQKLAGDHSF
jgi:putative transposase